MKNESEKENKKAFKIANEDDGFHHSYTTKHFYFTVICQITILCLHMFNDNYISLSKCRRGLPNNVPFFIKFIETILGIQWDFKVSVDIELYILAFLTEVVFALMLLDQIKNILSDWRGNIVINLVNIILVFFTRFCKILLAIFYLPFSIMCATGNFYVVITDEFQRRCYFDYDSVLFSMAVINVSLGCLVVIVLESFEKPIYFLMKPKPQEFLIVML